MSFKDTREQLRRVLVLWFIMQVPLNPRSTFLEFNNNYLGACQYFDDHELLFPYDLDKCVECSDCVRQN